ncbi:MAG: hypothetical protein R3293_29105 [Candidatus Promineifilaceae bacterium]|nr:hypothetical protein [Candidatus Promineifilaceae bacterium]
MTKLTLFIIFLGFSAATGLFLQHTSIPAIKALTTAEKIAVQREQQSSAILRSTVRIHLRSWTVKEDESGYIWDESIGHATLRDGRFLVTHNHYALLDKGTAPAGMSVALFNSRGTLLFSAPFTDFQVTQEGAETLVFELKPDHWQRQLAASGIISAPFAGWQELDLQPGMEVGQIDWDGATSRVDWATVEAVNTQDGVPRVTLNEWVTQGGSGGGVFWNGTHIGNNWQAAEHLDGAGTVVGFTSVAALNE